MIELSAVELIGSFVLVAGSIGAFARYLLSKGSANRDDVAAFKLHVAETYVTKAGLNTQTKQIMDAIHVVGLDVSRMNERIDRVIEVRRASAAAD
jgi:hypothetical protein